MRFALVILFAAAPVEAQGTVFVVVENGAPEARVRAWSDRLEPDVPLSLAEWAAAREPVDTIDPSALDALAQIEGLLVEARLRAVRLEERAALEALAQAEEMAEQHFEVPGMSAWYAEIELAIAVIAAQAEMTALSEAALRRAASVDPSRAIQMGEARPELVERSRAAVRAVAVGPRGRFEVRANVSGAHAFLDDRPLGALPEVVEAPRGRHVLRIEAPGHRPWAEAVDVLEGDRAAVSVDLSPTALREGAQALERAARAGDLQAVERGLAALGDAPPIAILFVGAGPEDRAVLASCDGGCARERLEPSGRGGAEGDLRADLAWLGSTRVEVVPTPWWEEWYVWAVSGALLAAAAITLGAVLGQPQGSGPLRIEVDSNDLLLPGVD